MKEGAAGPRRAALLVALLLVLGGLSWVSTGTTAGFATAEACTGSCHADLSPVHLGTHEESGCGTCHRSSFGEAALLQFRALLSLSVTSTHAAPSSARCATCHNEDNYDWVELQGTEGHSKHAEKPKVECVSCHREPGRERMTSTTVCLECHDDASLHQPAPHDPTSRSPECLACHNFRRATPERGVSIQEGCALCHDPGSSAKARAADSPVVHPGDLHGKVDCRLCHDPHTKASARGSCSGCHDVGLAARPDMPPEHHTCTSCHEQHAPLKTAGRRCGECHDQAKSRPEDPTTALRHDSCSSCHTPHSWVAVPNGCVNCHQSETSLVFANAPVEHQRCVGCHEVHGPNATGAICASCHQANASGLRRAPEQHQDCVNCHQPHTAEVDASRPCATCHTRPLHQLLASGLATHRKNGCAGCHTPHQDPTAGAQPCARCHENEHQAARAGPETHQTCSSCHEPHRFTIGKDQPCTKCHEAMASATAIHQEKCSECHAPHGSPEVSRQACLSCHDEVHIEPPARAPEHGRCASCHEPHKKGEFAAARCAGCHEAQGTVAQSWPKGSPHENDCRGCHQPHAVSSVAACGGCHKAQQAQATATHDCTTCHAPHSKPAPNTRGWWTTCANCHAAEATRAKNHADCNACHQPHGFDVPACTSCHEDVPKQAAHRMTEHRDCTTCHDAHGASLPGRAECVACHKDKTNHQPTANQCYGCHLFK